MFDHGFPSDWSTLKKLIWLKGVIAGGASAVWKTVSGTLIHLTDALASPMQKCEVTLEPIQAGSGDPSPDNVRPITGWTGCEVNVTGANVWDEQYQLGYWDIANGSYHSANNEICSKNYIPVKPDTEYRLVGLPSAIYLLFYDSEKGYLSRQSKSSTFTTPANAYFMHINLGSGYGTTYNNDVSVNYPSTDTSYHAYSGTTLSVTFPDTVYGGTDELISGNIKSEWVKEAFTKDDNYSGWSKQDSGTTQSGGYWIAITKTVSNPGYITTSSGDGKGFLNVGDWRQGSVSGHNRAYISSMRDTDLRIVFAAEEDIRTMAGLKTWVESFAGDDLDKYPHVVYKIKTALEYSHTPIPVNTLQGENNIWADCGDMEITYKAQV